MSKDNCDIINLGRWLLDLISDILGCNCKKENSKVKKLVKLDKLYGGFVILIIYLPIISVLFMVGELFLGLLGIAIVIGASAIAIYLEMRRGRGKRTS